MIPRTGEPLTYTLSIQIFVNSQKQRYSLGNKIPVGILSK